MSNRRTILLALVAIAALIAAEVMLERRGARSSMGRSSLVEAESSVVEIAVERRGAPLVRLEFNDGWKMVEPFRGDANEPTVLKLLDALTQSVVPDKISDSDLAKVGKDRSDFSLVEPHLKISLRTSQGAVASVAFGIPTPSADGVYAAVEGVNAVFIAPMSIFEAVDVTADEMRRRALFGLNAESVREVGIRYGEKPPVVFVRDGDVWRCGGRPASSARLKEYLDLLVGAKAQTFVWPVGATNEADHASAALLSGYGLDAESTVTVALKAADGTERRIAFGKDAADGSSYALVLNGSAVVTVPSELREVSAQNPMRFVDARLFPVEASAVSAFTVLDADTAYTLARADKRGWRLESPVMAEADQQVVDAMLERIVNLSEKDVDPSGVSVSLSSDRDPIRVARAAVLPREGVNAIRSKSVLKVDPEAIRRLVRTPAANEGGQTAVVYSRERKGWSVEKPEGSGAVDIKAVKTAVNALVDLNAVRVEKLKVTASDLDDYGLDTPYMTIAIDQDREGSVRRNLLIGKRTSGGRFVTVGSTDAIFVVADEALEKITQPLVSGL